jgi:hypothetical protein
MFPPFIFNFDPNRFVPFNLVHFRHPASPVFDLVYEIKMKIKMGERLSRSISFVFIPSCRDKGRPSNSSNTSTNDCSSTSRKSYDVSRVLGTHNRAPCCLPLFSKPGDHVAKNPLLDYKSSRTLVLRIVATRRREPGRVHPRTVHSMWW